jgi:RNA polymerase sigma-70 factor (ECF subfamily)
MADRLTGEHPPLADFSPAEITDRSLLRRLRVGSQDAATQLYLRYAARLRQISRARCSPDLAARVDSDDIVQSVFRTFFRRASRGEYDVPDGEDLWNLLLVIGLNKIQTVGQFHRAAKRDVRASKGNALLEFVGGEPDATALTILRMSIDEMLDEMSPSHRDIIRLRIEGHEVAEIAGRVRRSKRSVERVLQQIRKQVAHMIQVDD